MTPQTPAADAAAPGEPIAAPAPSTIRTRHHLTRAVRLSPAEIRRATREVKGFNAKLAVVITHAVGSMAMAWRYAAMASSSLPWS